MNLRNHHLKISFTGKSAALFFTVLCLLQLFGCATRQTFSRDTLSVEEKEKIQQEFPAELQPYYIDLQEEGERNRVLNYMKLGKAAYDHGYKDIAHKSFLRATTGIETIYGYDQAAADARSLWKEEGAKIFKGEPYERSMAFFYQGLTFIDEGDYENARASFMSGQLQDAFAEDEQFRTDFALLLYMDGWCSLALNDVELARQRFDEMRRIRPEVALPKAEDNLLVLVETGTSPRKVADGPGHSELKFRRGRNFMDISAEISVDNATSKPAYALEDIYYQAATRGGREVDKIVEGKARFRSNVTKSGSSLSDLGSTAVVVAPIFNNASNLGLAGRAFGLVGVASMAVGQSTRPHADTRYWDSLPDGYHVMSMHLPPGSHSITVTYLDKDGTPVSTTTKDIVITDGDQTKKMLWFASSHAK